MHIKAAPELVSSFLYKDIQSRNTVILYSLSFFLVDGSNIIGAGLWTQPRRITHTFNFVKKLRKSTLRPNYKV